VIGREDNNGHFNKIGALRMNFRHNLFKMDKLKKTKNKLKSFKILFGYRLILKDKWFLMINLNQL